MAQSNKRYFNTFFYEDPYIEDLDSSTTLLYLTMILNPHNNLAGVYEISIRKLMNYTKLSEDQVKIGIQKLTEDKKILFSGNWLALKNFIKNNELNPNMCKKAYDIMAVAPRDKIVFILSDSNGGIEPWVTAFTQKVESGINSAIDSQNRNAMSYAKKKSLNLPLDKSHRVFNIQHLLKSLFSASKPSLEGTIGGTIPIQQGDTLGEYKEEIEYEYKKEIEIEIEEETQELTDQQVVDNFSKLNKIVGNAVKKTDSKFKPFNPNENRIIQ
jgi:hypothetical protein